MSNEVHPLVALRKTRGLTQLDVALGAGVSVGGVARLESGAKINRSLVLGEVAHALGVPAREIASEGQRGAARRIDQLRTVR